MTPYVGQIVIYHNGIPKVCCVPSVITRVWSDTCVNLSMLSGPFIGCDQISVPLNEGPSTDDFSWSYTDADRSLAAALDENEAAIAEEIAKAVAEAREASAEIEKDA